MTTSVAIVTDALKHSNNLVCLEMIAIATFWAIATVAR